MKKNYFTIVFLALVLLASFLTTDQSVRVMKNVFLPEKVVEEKQLVVVIDPGHGGRDPGKVGVNKALEKDINLSVAKRLRDLLELNDIKVIMTREEDIDLYTGTGGSKKVADLSKRVEIIHSSNADMAISIHQNSFTSPEIRGAQVFYYSKSEQGKQLATILQEQLKTTLADGNHRMAKSNNDYFMLRKTQCPFVIVECGYLSNPREAALLLEGDYQEKLAWAIHLGVIRYINEGKVK